MDETITLRVLGPDDFDILMAIPEGLFDEPMRPDHARTFLDDPLLDYVLAFNGDLAVGMATGTILLHPDRQCTSNRALPQHESGRRVLIKNDHIPLGRPRLGIRDRLIDLLK